MLQLLTKYLTSSDGYGRQKLNILTLIAVVEVNPEPSDFLKNKGSYETSNRFKCTLYKHSFISNEDKFLDNSQKVRTPEFKRETNLSIRGF